MSEEGDQGEEIYIGETISKNPTVQEVNQHLLNKLDALIQATNDPDGIASLTESLAKYNTSVRNNQIFKEESEEEKRERENRAVLEGILGK